MTRNQNLAVAFLLIILVATIMLTAYVATVHAAPAATNFRPPRATATAQDANDDDAPSRPRIVPTGRPCEMNRWTTPRNCNPDRRPADRRVPR